MTHYRLSFNGPIFEQQANALCARVAMVLERPDFASLTVLFSADGGAAEQSIALYNFLRAAPQPLRFHATGQVSGVALPVFLAGQKRGCVSASRFTLEALARPVEGRQGFDRLTAEVARLESDIQLFQDIFRRHARIPDSLLETLRRSTAAPAVFTPVQAKDYGIVEEIAELNPDGVVQQDTAVWTVGW
jgi:ATP-dependent protease ClpP protease subunit